jgi:hypothetical protein
MDLCSALRIILQHEMAQMQASINSQFAIVNQRISNMDSRLAQVQSCAVVQSSSSSSWNSSVVSSPKGGPHCQDPPSAAIVAGILLGPQHQQPVLPLQDASYLAPTCGDFAFGDHDALSTCATAGGSVPGSMHRFTSKPSAGIAGGSDSNPGNSSAELLGSGAEAEHNPKQCALCAFVFKHKR